MAQENDGSLTLFLAVWTLYLLAIFAMSDFIIVLILFARRDSDSTMSTSLVLTFTSVRRMNLSRIPLTVAIVNPIYDLHISASLLCTSISPCLPETSQADIPRVHSAIPPTTPDHFLDRRFGQWTGGGSAATTMHAVSGLSRALASWTELHAAPISHRSGCGGAVSFNWHLTVPLG